MSDYDKGLLRAAEMLCAALKAKIQMEGRNGVHKKLEDHLIWRENDILAQKMADDAIAAYEAIRAEAGQPDCVVVPVEIPKMSITDPDYDSHHDAYRQGWNACRKAMLRAAKEPTK